MIQKLGPKKSESKKNCERTILKDPKPESAPSLNREMAWTKDVDHKNNSYLVLTNHAGRTIKAGEQIMFFYGRDDNSQLLRDYGFCYRDNRFDHYEVSLKMKPSSFKPEDILSFDWEQMDGI